MSCGVFQVPKPCESIVVATNESPIRECCKHSDLASDRSEKQSIGGLAALSRTLGNSNLVCLDLEIYLTLQL